MTTTTIDRLPPNWDECLTEAGKKIYVDLIEKRLPKGLYLVDAEIHGPAFEEVEDFDVKEILAAAGEELREIEDVGEEELTNF